MGREHDWRHQPAHLDDGHRGRRSTFDTDEEPQPIRVSAALAHAWIGGELRAVESIVLSEGLVLDRAAVARLSRPLAVVSALHELHPVDEAGRCRACRVRWSRERGCAVWPLLASNYAQYLATIGGPPGVHVTEP